MKMLDYKEMYLKMFRASEQAMNIIISAQRESEELYISMTEPGTKIVSLPTKNSKGVDEE
ncbi:MAG: hypothetical protein K0S60_171 [Evtepia sp.]|jgi:hypothetical protein|nr:hypothetical protein [Evtepia sp.]